MTQKYFRTPNKGPYDVLGGFGAASGDSKLFRSKAELKGGSGGSWDSEKNLGSL